MKFRNGFVSNSSCTSYVVILTKDYFKPGWFYDWIEDIEAFYKLAGVKAVKRCSKRTAFHLRKWIKSHATVYPYHLQEALEGREVNFNDFIAFLFALLDKHKPYYFTYISKEIGADPEGDCIVFQDSMSIRQYEF